ncbi:hypothetical protein TNCV_3861871 [Trichonephila clavipes]|nr:hypothetical protein TNCV_3861871 [Trichonephila clavipes]
MISHLVPLKTRRAEMPMHFKYMPRFKHPPIAMVGKLGEESARARVSSLDLGSNITPSYSCVVRRKDTKTTTQLKDDFKHMFPNHTPSVHRCPTRRVFSGTGLELVTKPATIRYLYHSATTATMVSRADMGWKLASRAICPVLVRILCFYLYRRRLEASGLPIDPIETLSFANYMRMLVFLSPKGIVLHDGSIVDLYQGEKEEIDSLLPCERTATAGSDVVQSGRSIFDDFFQHLWPYIGNNTANVVFEMVKRLWLIRMD